MKMRAVFTMITAFALCSATAYELKKVSSPLKIDGKAEAVWAQAEPVRLFKWRSNKAAPFMASTVKFLYDDTNLYCLAEFQEVNINEARMQSPKYTRRDAPVYENDCCELFIDPFRDGKRCFHLVVDIHGAVADLLHSDPKRYRNPFSWDGFWRSAVHQGEEMWSVEYAIPWSTINVVPGKERRIGVNLSRSRRCNPTERSVIVDKQSLQSTPDYIQMSADIKPLPVTGSIEYGALFSGKNKIQIILKNSTAKIQQGTLQLSGLYPDSRPAFSQKLPVTLQPGKTAKITAEISIPTPGNINISADMLLTGSQIIFIGSSNANAMPPFDINDPHPMVFQGEKWGVYLRIFTPGKRNLRVEITRNGKTAAVKDHKDLQGKQFITLPTVELHPGEYILRFISGKDIVSVPLRIFARP